MDYLIRHQKSGLDCRLDWSKMTWTETAVQSIFQSSPVQSRLNLQSNRLDLKILIMTEQQENINVATGATGQEIQRINVITNPGNGTLKGNSPPIFNGDRSTTQRFLVNFDLWKATNQNNDAMKKPFSRVITMLSYMAHNSATGRQYIYVIPYAILPMPS